MNTAELERPVLRDILTDVIGYWERRRLYYNLILALVVVGMALLIWPRTLRLLSLQNLLWIFVLAVLANVCYSAAYAVDIVVQLSAYREGWRRWRILLWILGTLLAVAVTYIWMSIQILGLIL